MRAFVTFTMCKTGVMVDVGPGEIIGRSPMAALCLEDPQISEAHSLVSLRGQSLMLLGLRGRFRVPGKIQTEVVLTNGLRIELAPNIEIECSEVCSARVAGPEIGVGV